MLCLGVVTFCHSLASCRAATLVDRFAADTTGAGPAAVHLARRALDEYCLHRVRLTVPGGLPPLLAQRGAVFVSAQVAGAPRCCMGSLYPRGATLAADLIEMACRAAAHDLRFAPLRPEELAGLRVIVSVLDPPEPVTDPWTLDPLNDGLAARGPRRTGVVLPGETGVQERFVRWAQMRAGLQPDERVVYLRLRAVRFIEPEG